VGSPRRPAHRSRPGPPTPPPRHLQAHRRPASPVRRHDLGRDRIYGHIKPVKNRTAFLTFCRYLRSLYPADVRIAIVCDNFSPHLSTKLDTRVGDWARDNNVELAHTPTNCSWLNRIEASSRRCATSPSTVPTTPHTTSRPA